MFSEGKCHFFLLVSLGALVCNLFLAGSRMVQPTHRARIVHAPCTHRARILHVGWIPHGTAKTPCTIVHAPCMIVHDRARTVHDRA